MKQSFRPRSAATLSVSVHSQLNIYGVMASAAGVSLLALSQPCEAKIVYTKAHHVIGTNGVYDLDLNHDGITDFLILESGNATFNGTAGNNTLLAKEALGNAVVGALGKYGRHFASALKRGAQIGPGRRFIHGGPNGETLADSWVSDSGAGQSGQWLNVTNRYLGVRFKIAGKMHYGWARLTVKVPGNFVINTTLTGYAYETVAGKSIPAGQTMDKTGDRNATVLGQLALGARDVRNRR